LGHAKTTAKRAEHAMGAKILSISELTSCASTMSSRRSKNVARARRTRPEVERRFLAVSRPLGEPGSAESNRRDRQKRQRKLFVSIRLARLARLAVNHSRTRDIAQTGSSFSHEAGRQEETR
jgi:hypothetical protein